VNRGTSHYRSKLFEVTLHRAKPSGARGFVEEAFRGEERHYYPPVQVVAVVVPQAAKILISATSSEVVE